MSVPTIEPGQVWFVDFDPTRGRERGKAELDEVRHVLAQMLFT